MQIQQQGLHPLYKSKYAQLYASQCSKCFSVNHYESSDTSDRIFILETVYLVFVGWRSIEQFNT